MNVKIFRRCKAWYLYSKDWILLSYIVNIYYKIEESCIDIWKIQLYPRLYKVIGEDVPVWNVSRGRFRSLPKEGVLKVVHLVYDLSLYNFVSEWVLVSISFYLSGMVICHSASPKRFSKSF